MHIGVTSVIFLQEKCPYLFTLQKPLYEFISYCTIRTNVRLRQTKIDIDVNTFIRKLFCVFLLKTNLN